MNLMRERGKWNRNVHMAKPVLHLCMSLLKKPNQTKALQAYALQQLNCWGQRGAQRRRRGVEEGPLMLSLVHQGCSLAGHRWLSGPGVLEDSCPRAGHEAVTPAMAPVLDVIGAPATTCAGLGNQIGGTAPESGPQIWFGSFFQIILWCVGGHSERLLIFVW